MRKDREPHEEHCLEIFGTASLIWGGSSLIPRPRGRRETWPGYEAREGPPSFHTISVCHAITV